MKYILKHPFLTGAVLLTTINNALITHAAELPREPNKDQEVKESLNQNEQAGRETWTEFNEYFNSFDLRINQLANDMNKNIVYSFSNKIPSNSISTRPNIDITSTDKQYLIRVEVPGIEEDETTINKRHITLNIYYIIDCSSIR